MKDSRCVHLHTQAVVLITPWMESCSCIVGVCICMCVWASRWIWSLRKNEFYLILMNSFPCSHFSLFPKQHCCFFLQCLFLQSHFSHSKNDKSSTTDTTKNLVVFNSILNSSLCHIKGKKKKKSLKRGFPTSLSSPSIHKGMTVISFTLLHASVCPGQIFFFSIREML